MSFSWWPKNCYNGMLVSRDSNDLVLTNGKIITVDPGDSIAQAVAIRSGKIVAVGSNQRARDAVPRGTRLIDLHGSTATPGLIDSHCHFQEVDVLYSVELSDPLITRIDDVLERVRAKVAGLKAGEWVRGSGWDEGKYAERRYILASDLDRVAPDNPVFLMHTTARHGVANGYALRLANITPDTPNPAGGSIERDSRGQPTGILKDSAAALVSRLIPRYTHDQLRNGLLRIVQDFNKEGMTAVKDACIGQDKWELYEELQRDGKLNVRVFALWSGGRTMDQARALFERVSSIPKRTGDFLLSGGLKMFMDGSGGARTAWMYQDWHKNFTGTDTGNSGYPVTDPAVYFDIVKMFHKAGFHIGTHAIGDRAIDWVVETYCRVLTAHPARGLRHAVIHANTPSDRAIQMMSALQREYEAGYPEAQAPFLWWLGDTYAGNLGPERVGRLKPFGTYLNNGIMWSGGSDYPVAPFAARYGLWASVERKTLQGVYGEQPFGTAESIDIHTALRSYTAWAARQLFLEDRIGTIEIGKDADIAVWDRDVYTISPQSVKDMKCQMTLVNGRIVHEAW
jgi:predicted amidohydrolase YtcJ